MIVALIPARGGSKGIKNKNLLELAGKTLLRRSVDAAINSKAFDAVYVSTNDEAIAAATLEAGAGLISRPGHLCGDHSLTVDAVIHAIKELNLALTDIVCVLQCTSPLRNELHIREAFTILNDCRVASLISVCECEHHPAKTFIEREGTLVPAFNKADLEAPRQDLGRACRPNGAIYISRVGSIIEERSLISSSLCIYEMDRASSIDIDNMEDFKQAEFFLREIS